MMSNVETFKQAFREEAREILVELEATLLELAVDRDQPELVGAAFRGLHTIKGSGAMFGFDELAGFTHNLENAFDEVRNGRLAVTAELVDLSLAALDQIKGFLEEEPGGDAGAAARERILAGLRELGGVDSRSRAGESAPADAEPGGEAGVKSGVKSGVEPGGEAEGEEAVWRIAFAPGPDLMRDGTNPILLLNELRGLGEMALTASVAAVPPLRELDPERCYISWEAELRSGRGEDAIRDVFIFVEDQCELLIERLGGAKKLVSDLESGGPGADPVAGAVHAARALEEPRAASGGRRAYDRPDTASSLRVPAAKLDQFVDLVGELVTVQARLGELATRHGDPEMVAVAEEIERLTSSLRENSMNIRMMPIRATFERFRRLVHDLARDLGKSVELTIEGAETELDKTVIDQLADPLMHLIRNSMDHGIEPPDARLAAGKRATASIRLSARHSGASVLIGVADDGGGIDMDAVRSRGVERGLVAADAQLSEQEIYALIFQPGFSTAKQITDVSGRGVGMDVVRQRVEALRGSIEVASRPGQGTSVTLRLPLTMAIIDGLLVTVGGAHFVLPLANTLECIELTGEDIVRANGKHVANVRGEILPYIRLQEHFGIRSERRELEQIMLVETEEGRFGFVVDQVLGDCQTVIKNLGRLYRHVQVVSGATILGDGTVALILDPHRLVQEAIRESRHRPRGHPAEGVGNGRKLNGFRPWAQ